MNLKDRYTHTYNSFSGCDMVAVINIPGVEKTMVIGELQTISYSIHREVSPVRALGRINPKGFTRGPRTIAGSLIFTVFDNNIVNKIMQEMNRAEDKRMDHVVMDEMPPFDVVITMVNEYGQSSYMVIEEIVVVDEGQVMSIEDMITENTMSYMARDIKPLIDKEVEIIQKQKYPVHPGESDLNRSHTQYADGTVVYHD